MSHGPVCQGEEQVVRVACLQNVERDRAPGLLQLERAVQHKHTVKIVGGLKSAEPVSGRRGGAFQRLPQIDEEGGALTELTPGIYAPALSLRQQPAVAQR